MVELIRPSRQSGAVIWELIGRPIVMPTLDGLG